MKKKLVFLILMLFLIVSCENLQNPTTTTNISNGTSNNSEATSASSSIPSNYTETSLIRNGLFASSKIEWNAYVANDGKTSLEMSIVNQELKISASKGNNPWDPRIDQMNIMFKKDQAYVLEYKAKTNVQSKRMQVQIGELLDHDPWFDNFGFVEQVELTPSYKMYTHLFYISVDNNKGGIIFEMGNFYIEEANNFEIYFDNIKLYEYNQEVQTVYKSFSEITSEPIITSVPAIRITTDIIKDINKEDYLSGKLTLVDNVNPENNLTNEIMGIRGRGNSTWGMPKKPYRIKFDKKKDLFNMGATKSWVLLANYADKSLLRNYAAFGMSKSLSGLAFTPGAIVVELYLNNNYQGVYLLTNQIETGVDRVNIETKYTVDDVEIPFLIEWDMRAQDYPSVENKDFIYLTLKDGTKIPFGTKYPDDFAVITPLQLNFIKTYLKNASDAILNLNNYEQYIDVDSFIDYFIVQEIAKNVDVGFSSVYMYKAKDGKLTMGPVWDFDLAYGNADYIDYGPYGWRNANQWFMSLMKDQTFRLKFKNRLNLKKVEFIDILNNVAIAGRDISEAANRNFTYWPRLGLYDWPNPQPLVAANTYEKQVFYLVNWMNQRLNWMIDELNKS